VFSKAEAWIDLLLMMNHEDNKVLLGNQFILVKRGSRITSVKQLCKRWGWSNTKVASYLTLLESDEMIVKKSDTKKTLITVVNWDLYQIETSAKTSPKRHRNVTETIREHTNKNDIRMIKNDKEIYTSTFDEFWNQYPKKQAKQDAVKAWGKIKMTDDLSTAIMDGLTKAKQSRQWREGYIPNPATWLNGRRWEDEYTPTKESNLINGHRY
jgi:DNA replication protein DnaD